MTPPGSVVAVLRGGEPVELTARGFAHTLGERRPMTPDTIFDVGSITKLFTTAAVMTLVERGALDVDAPAAEWLPELRAEGVTLADLLAHRAGLWEWWPLYVRARDREAAVARAATLLRYPPRSGRHYSDLGLMLVGEAARRATGREVDALIEELVLRPLGLADTRFTPDPALRARIAATSVGDAIEREMVATGRPYPVTEDAAAFPRWRQHVLVGEVNDGNAHHAFGGVAAHAGLFTTAGDLAAFGAALLGGAPWSAETVRRFTSEPHDAGQGLGFWTRRLEPLGRDEPAFGHGGFPGAQLAVVPGREIVVVLLTNRLHVAGPPVDIQPLWEDVLRSALR